MFYQFIILFLKQEIFNQDILAGQEEKENVEVDPHDNPASEITQHQDAGQEMDQAESISGAAAVEVEDIFAEEEEVPSSDLGIHKNYGAINEKNISYPKSDKNQAVQKTVHGKEKEIPKDNATPMAKESPKARTAPRSKILPTTPNTPVPTVSGSSKKGKGASGKSSFKGKGVARKLSVSPLETSRKRPKRDTSPEVETTDDDDVSQTVSVKRQYMFVYLCFQLYTLVGPTNPRE